MPDQKGDQSLRTACTEEIKKQLALQRKRRPQMKEEDTVKFVFQGMLGVGHLVASPGEALIRLDREYREVSTDDTEPLTEKLSTDWIRLNLRPAKAQGMTAEEIAGYVFESAGIRPLPFTRQDVCDFCVKLDSGNEKMRAAAEKMLDENRLPSHSDDYREAYHPAYRVLYQKIMKTGKET